MKSRIEAITITVEKQGKSEKLTEVGAIVWGTPALVAVHKSLNGTLWTVTHVPTGFRFGVGFVDKWRAEGAAEELARYLGNDQGNYTTDAEAFRRNLSPVEREAIYQIGERWRYA